MSTKTQYEAITYLSYIQDVLEQTEYRIDNMLEHDKKRSVGLSDSDRFWMLESKVNLYEARLKAKKILEEHYNDV